DVVYPNGISTSLPEDVQDAYVRSIVGLENCEILQPGYAIEYDYVDPRCLTDQLQLRACPGLYLAGQINGTTGYEEAASQGLMAGINAAQKVKEKDPLIIRRDEGYIGVLIDDLVNKGTKEPYRMFTSRAEYRTLLRQDNADLRLTEIGYKVGVASEERYQAMLEKKSEVASILKVLENTSVSPAELNGYLESQGTSQLKQKVKAHSVLTRPQISLKGLLQSSDSLGNALGGVDEIALEQAEIQSKYAGYIRKEQELAQKMMRLDEVIIPMDFNFRNLKALSSEGREKLSHHQPANLGQASRISGVSPADISVLLVHMGR
ncbi:MAG: FAD-dependent oxidoreductase, partial [Bacteroidota bacterium]